MNKYKIRIKSRHPSHNILRTNLPKLPIKSVVRFGSISEVVGEIIEINSIESIKISSDKLLMKKKFNEAEINTARWTFGDDIDEVIENLGDLEIPYPIVAKSRFGSRGIGNSLLKNEDDLKNWSTGRDISKYIFEKYMSYLLEYRLHITKNGCFYTCRKALKSNTPQNERWHRHIDTSTWFLETNEKFNKPNSWDTIVEHCVKALKIIGADVLSDVRVQSSLNKKGEERDFQNFIIIECNSASSMNKLPNNEVSVCAQHYLIVIPELIVEKAGLGEYE